ncbi:putative ribonuclease H-like domain-containing protein [Tanacetum coccineum]
MTHSSPKRNMVPKAVLMRSGLVSLTTARPVNTAQPKTIVNSVRLMTNVFNKAHSPIRRTINNKTATKNSNFNKRVNTISGKNVNTARPKAVVNAARPKVVLNVVKGNQVNAVKASACWVWKPKTKVIDHVSKQCINHSEKGIPQMDLQDKDGLETLNLKTMNKLVKGNLVRGLPSKLFEINQTCVACQKGKDHRASCKARMETVPGKDYILLPLWPADLPFSQNSKSSPDAGFKPSGDNEKKVTKEPGKQGGDPSNKNDSVNSTNNINTASDGNNTNNVNTVSSTVNTVGIEVNAVSSNTSIELPNDPNMPELEDIVYSDDYEDVGAEADMNNLNTFMSCLSILNYKITQRSSSLNNYCRLEFRPQQVEWTIEFEWINYDEVFAPVAKIEAIKVFLAYASFKDFVVYQMDVKSAFLYGKFKEEVYVCQPPGFEDPDFPDRVYKVEKALYGLHQAPRAWRQAVDRKSTKEGCHFLGFRLISWLCKIEMWLFNSTTKAEYIAASVVVIVDFLNASSIRYALTVNPTIYTLCIEQFWATVKVKTVNGEQQLQALVDGKKIIITEATVRRDLQLKDAEGVDCLPNATIFEQLTLMGYEKLSQKLTFYKAFFSPQWKFLIHTILQCLSAKTTAWNEFSSTMASAIICLATNQKFNFSKYIFESMVKNLDNAVKFLMYPRFVQVFLNNQLEGMETHNKIYIAPSHTEKIFANMRRQGKDFSRRETPLFPTMMVQAQKEMGKDEAVTKEPCMQLKELIDFCTKLQQRVLDLENTKIAQAQEITRLKKRVKKLEKKRGSRTHRLKRLYKVGRSRRVKSSEDESLGDQEDASKQGRIYDIDADKDIYLVNVYKDDDMFGVNDLEGDEVVVETLKSAKVQEKGDVIKEPSVPVSAASTKVSTVIPTTATTTITVVSPRYRAKRIVFQEQEQEQEQAPTPIVSSQQSTQVKDKAQEQEELFDAEKATLFVQLLEKRRKYFTAKRAEEKRNRPPTKAQQRSFMCTYLKNMEGWKPKDLKNKSFANIHDLFDKAMKRVDDDKETEELKQCMEIIPDDGDDVTIEATPLSTKSPTIVNYKINQGREKKSILTLSEQMMFNDVKLQVYCECEMPFELLRLVKKQVKEGSVPE